MKINYWKWGVIAVAIIAWSLFMRSCGINSVIKTSRIDTFLSVDIDTFPSYVPVPSEVKPGKIEYRPKRDTVWLDPEKEIVYLPEDLSPELITMLNDYNRTITYNDTSVAGLTLLDTVTHNRIAGRQIIKKDTITTIKETTILQPPKRMIGYFSLSASRYSAGAGIGLKTKNDWLYSIELKTDHGIHPEIRLFKPIRFKKTPK